ncbi:amidase domain-containing protein [Streptomyces sp. 5-8]|uniref:Amidase domain-containing protein n=1 Tax=Streptomyces musisoli TaxID=2802280 RepID=A0ABS1PBN4_9ACTN|nr:MULTISPECIES: amidase domain-containing protein [Streptomyces]MBL1109763.1 amidase domain-containing protein [Streptomyces musisoli]MBY8846734.1 amidase domain-containing protein [Streptomyces sp. SP2-10]
MKPATTAAYSYNKMIAYAEKYWKHHNSAFRTYGGNDCTNFLSQIMLAGGWKPAGGSIIQRTSNKYWFYGPVSLWTSYTWGGAENWYWYDTHNKPVSTLVSDHPNTWWYAHRT